MKVLYINCCISQRGEGSRTARLCTAFLDALRQETGADVECVDLRSLRLEPFTVSLLDRRDALFRAGAFDDEVYALARQFRDADGIVVGAPFWDLSFPAQLRIYIEHISANGVTYYYDERGPHGNCSAKWLVYLTSGGDFEHAGSLGTEYWRQLCGMYGIGCCRSLFAGGLDADPARSETLLSGTCEKAAGLARELASGADAARQS